MKSATISCSQPELLGKSCFEFIHTEDQSHMKESFDQVVKMKGQVRTGQHKTNAPTNQTNKQKD